MCGILGWMGAADSIAAERFEAALDLIRHRGPDDHGVFQAPGLLLGMRRLAILDLSEAGHQPMTDPESGAVIVFNGEIYNHVELRRELEGLGHRFAGHSDSEVLLHAMVEWGEAALPRLNGMWAFAFWRPDTQSLLLSRDRFGVKPLYYRTGASGFAFASEPKSLLAMFPEHRRVARDTLLRFLADNRLPMDGESFYAGIQVLPPASVATSDGNALRISRYWNYPEATDEDIAADDAIEHFRLLFDDAVKLRLRSDVPVGLTLSGGLDSTGILAAAAGHSTTPLTCFTSVYGDKGNGELAWATKAAAAVGAELRPVSASTSDWLPTLGHIAWHMDGPGYSPAVYPLWQLMKGARAAGVPVLLEGQGADEALAGYTQYAVLDLLAALGGRGAARTGGGIVRRLRRLRAASSLRWAAAWTAREAMPGLLGLHRRRVGFRAVLREGVTLPETVPITEPHSGDRVRDRLLTDHAEAILPGLLHYGDAISMAHSIESRQPFLDYRLVEWLFRLPTRFKLHDGETKWVLRQYLRAHGQSAIADRRDKQGYPTPVRSWLGEGHRADVERLVLDPNSPLAEWCDPRRVKRLLAQNRAGVLAADHHLYKLVSTQVWLDTCIASAAR